MLRLPALLVPILFVCLLATQGFAAALIGNATTVVRDVRSEHDAKERILYVNDDIFQDEEVLTGPLSAARLIFQDGTNLSMGAQSKLKLTRVIFDPDPSKSRVAAKAALGVFRMATGKLPSSAYQVATPVATISVRGTIIEFTVTGIGTTTVFVAKGAATVLSSSGDAVDLEAGQSTTVRAAPAPDGGVVGLAPTDPGPPSTEFSGQIRAMTVTIRSDEPAADLSPAAGPPSAWRPSLPANAGPSGNPGLPGPNGGHTGGGALPPVIGVGLGGTAPQEGVATGGDGAGSPGGNPPGIPPPGTDPPGQAPGVSVSVQAPAVTRVGTQSQALVTITRIGGGAEAIVGTLGEAAGPFAGAGSGPGGVRLLPGGVAQYSYAFGPQARGSHVTALPFDFPGIGTGGVIELKGQAVGPVFKIPAEGGAIAVARSAHGQPLSHAIRLANETSDDGPLDLVGLTIFAAYLTGPGSELFRLEGLVPDTVLGAGEEAWATLRYEALFAGLDGLPDPGALDDITLVIETDLNAAFGTAGTTLHYRIAFADPVIVAAPGAGLALLAGGSLFLLVGARRAPLRGKHTVDA